MSETGMNIEKLLRGNSDDYLLQSRMDMRMRGRGKEDNRESDYDSNFLISSNPDTRGANLQWYSSDQSCL